MGGDPNRKCVVRPAKPERHGWPHWEQPCRRSWPRGAQVRGILGRKRLQEGRKLRKRRGNQDDTLAGRAPFDPQQLCNRGLVARVATQTENRFGRVGYHATFADDSGGAYQVLLTHVEGSKTR